MYITSGNIHSADLSGTVVNRHSVIMSASGINDTWLTFEFTAPPGGTPLEGISGPGDSGGPALIERDGKYLVAGVSSGNSGGDGEHCRYGTTEYYARVSTSADWIRTTISPPQPN